MYYLYRKELAAFFSSITGYLVVIIFLVANSLFMWVFSGNMNILQNGYATLDTLFDLSPWIFLFLVPAVTMRLFAEEKASGTIELLLSRPLTDIQIIISKYLAGLTLVLFSLLPCLLYFWSVYWLGNPVGNIDTGGTWGSFIGLFFLAAIYVAIGTFASTLTANQIISMLIAVLLCFFFYIGFDYIAAFFNSPSGFIVLLGINAHYDSMSRGVIDSRDIIYFLSVIGLFIFLARIVLQSRKW